MPLLPPSTCGGTFPQSARCGSTRAALGTLACPVGAGQSSRHTVATPGWTNPVRRCCAGTICKNRARQIGGVVVPVKK
jgi:hypothetical protein